MPAALSARHRVQSLITRIEVPQALRTLVRARETGLIVVAAMVGLLAGLIVAAMSFSVGFLHHLLFGVPLAADSNWVSKLFGFLALVLASVNIFGGFLVTQRMLAMYKKKERPAVAKH